MPQITKILVPVDFSAHSENALAFAARFASEFGASLHLVHVYPTAAYFAPALQPGPVLMGQFREQSQQAFDEFLLRMKGTYGVPLAGTLFEGVPHIEILRAIGETHADLVVMGTHGRTGFEHLLLGSVAERVMRSATVPVMTVPHS
jgi:nucleotide-binding universal stress UspA family protein